MTLRVLTQLHLVGIDHQRVAAVATREDVDLRALLLAQLVQLAVRDARVATLAVVLQLAVFA